MEDAMRAVDVMTTGVISVQPDASIGEVAKLMLERRISGLPVIDGAGKLVGIVSEGDLLRRVEADTERRRPRWLEMFATNTTLAAEYVKSHAKRVADVMTAPVVTVRDDAPLAEIADLLETKRVKRLPVVRDGKVVGIVSRSNLLQAIASGAAAAASQPPKDDRAIREALVKELERQKWAAPGDSNIVVNDGVVHLWGFVMSQTERTALRVAAETIPGVRSVEDHLLERTVYAGM
jgi:CBS domain-containing protein